MPGIEKKRLLQSVPIFLMPGFFVLLPPNGGNNADWFLGTLYRSISLISDFLNLTKFKKSKGDQKIKKTIRQEIFEYLEKLPLNIELTLNNRQFILTHAAPVELYETYGHKYECERDFAVWMRFDSFPVLEDCTVIFGHTPTIRFQYDKPMAIWDVKSWIGIDCGCMLPEKGDPWSGALGRLSCLRLDDMQVFYSEEPQYDNLKISEEQHDG